MKSRLLRFFYWTLALSFIALLVWLMMAPDAETVAAERSADGQGIKTISWAGNGQKQITITAISQKNVDERRRFLYGFRAVLKPKDAKGEELTASADQAYLSNSDYNIELEKNVKIESPSLLLTGPYLLCKDQNHFSSDKQMTFVLKKISGRADKGLRYNAAKEVMKIFGVQGIMQQVDGSYDFSCRELTVNRNTHRLLLADDVLLGGAQRTLSCQNLSMDFDADMTQPIQALASGLVKVRAEMKADGSRLNTYLASAERMNNLYEQGLLKQSTLRGAVDVTIITLSGELHSQADVLDLYFDTLTGTVTQVVMPVRGTWSYQGRQRTFAATADQGDFFFNKDGELDRTQAKGMVVFKINTFNGEADELNYSPLRQTVDISGPKSWIKRDRQLFHGKKIQLNTAKSELSSSDGVVSSVSMKGRPPFGSEPVMITARAVRLQNRQDRVQYSGQVDLSQPKLKLRCQDLLIADGQINADGQVVFLFKDKNDSMLLKGEKLRIAGTKDPVFTVDGGAQLTMSNDQLSADQLVLGWKSASQGIDSIAANKKVRFTGAQYQVDADSLLWDMASEMMVFKGHVTIKKGKEFTSKGEEVELNTKTQQLKILSQAGKRNN